MNRINYFSNNILEVIEVSNQEINKFDNNYTQNNELPETEMFEKTMSGKVHEKSGATGTSSISKKVWKNKSYSHEVPISSAYPAIDNDLARDNIENDIPAADLQDL